MQTKDLRMDRMNKQLMRDISEIIRDELKLPESFKLLSITNVDLSTDLSAVKVYVSHLKDGESAPCVKALNDRAWEVRDYLKPRITWRKIPSVTFFEDDSLKKGFALIQKIDRLTKSSPSSTATGAPES